MGGATKEHKAISTNLAVMIWFFIKDKSYQLYHSDMRTYAPATGSYFYPDLVLVTGEPEFKDGTFDNLLNPWVVIEILSNCSAADPADGGCADGQGGFSGSGELTEV